MRAIPTSHRLTCGMLVLAALGNLPASGAVPAMINYQGKLTTAAGAPVTDGSYNTRFFLWDQEAGGALLWQEPAVGSRTVTVTGGIFNVLLGSVVALPASAFQGSTWLATEVNGALLTGRVRIVSVGYALRAQIAEGVVPNGVTSAMIANGAIKGEDMQVPFRIDGDSAFLQGLIDGRNAGVGIGVMGQARGGSGSVPGSGAGVFGDSSNGPGVVGYSKTGSAIFGQNLTNNNYGYLGHTSFGVYGGRSDLSATGGLGGTYFGQPAGVYGFADSTGNAGYFAGKVHITGEVEGSGGTGLPIASAFINASGTKNKGSANLTSSWDAVNQRYLITIAGEDYFYTDFAPVVTPVTAGLSCNAGSVSGKLTVEFNDANGTNVQSAFSVLVFRL